MRGFAIRAFCAMTLAIMLAVLSESAPSLSAYAADSKNATLDAIVRRLAQQERAVRTCECLLSYRTDPTSPKMIPLIKEELHNRPRIGGYIFSQKDADRRTYVGHWWRHGLKERFDQFPTFEELTRPGAKPTRVRACDGKLVRGYDVDTKPNDVDGAVIHGTIKPGEEGLGFNEAYPFAFLFEFQHHPYSELLSRARDVQVSEAAGRTIVTFGPKQMKYRFKLVFGPDGLLLERDHITQLSQDLTPRIYGHDVFSEYRTYRAASGEEIRFPSEIDSDYVLGTTDDGKLIVYRHDHIQVNSFQFNHDVPDNVFVIEFPAGCVVRDQTQLFRRRKAREAK
jgi:hypothetical protein